MKNNINVSLMLLIVSFLITSCVIPDGKLEKAKHDPTGSHDTTNTKLTTADSDKPFDRYISDVRAMIEKNAKNKYDTNEARLNAATPFQIKPGENNGKCDTNNSKNAALLIHGLTDTPFLMRDIGEYLNSEHCFLVRSILLPGHGTVPGDLADDKYVNYLDWINAAGYGINSFFNKNEDLGIENLYIIGFSTGGALALYHALYSTENPEFSKATNKLKGLILLSPAIQIKSELSAKFSNWHKAYSDFIPKGKWIDLAGDEDYAKYESFPKNAADQIHKLSDKVYCQENKILWEIPEVKGWPILEQLFCSENIDKLKVPVLMAMSKEDMTVDTEKAIEFFKKQSNENSVFILYHADNKNYDYGDKRIQQLKISEGDIIDFAHTSIPVSPTNKHYGKTDATGKTVYYNCVHYQSGNKNDNEDKHGKCKNPNYEEAKYGEISDNNINIHVLRRLTFNSQFANLTEQINQFINNTNKSNLNN